MFAMKVEYGWSANEVICSGWLTSCKQAAADARLRRKTPAFGTRVRWYGLFPEAEQVELTSCRR